MKGDVESNMSKNFSDVDDDPNWPTDEYDGYGVDIS